MLTNLPVPYNICVGVPSVSSVPHILSSGQYEEGGKWRWCCCCNIIKRLMSGTRRCMSTLLCSLFTSIHTNIISTLYILTLLLSPVKTSDERVWSCIGIIEYMDCELNRKSIFSVSERYSYSLHYYEAGQFAHLSREWILVSPAGLVASPSPRTPRRTADRHRPCPPRRTSPPPAVDILDILWQIFLIYSTCQSYTGTGRCFITCRNSDWNI